MNGFHELMSRASIKIYEYGIDERMQMMTRGRVFPFYVMSYISEGSAMLKINGQEIELQPQSVIIIPPNVEHDHYMVKKELCTFWWWHFDYKVYDTIDLLKLLRLPVVNKVKDKERFELLFKRYSQAMMGPNSVQNTLHRLACMLEVLGQLVEEIEAAKGEDSVDDVPEVFREMRETVISGEVNQLSLEYFAEKYNMHPTYISNRFSEYFGVPPIRLYRKIQLERAAKILESREKTVGEVAEMFGYSDVSVFSRLFKSVMGVSPSEVVNPDSPKSRRKNKNL